MRWKAIADGDELNNSEEETMALLAEAFELSGKYNTAQSGIIKWLLAAKQGEHWQSTKATGAVIDMLEKEKSGAFDQPKSISAEIGGQKITVSDGLLDGIPVTFAATKTLPQNLTLQKQGTGTTGALTWYYFATPDKLDTLNKAVKLSKQFYYRDAANKWVPFNQNTILKPGDKVQVKLKMQTVTQLKYAHISDPRAAAFEPGDNKSGYQYSGGLSYYQSVRDTGLELFAEEIPQGISEIVYEITVARTGEFASGPAKLQCMYAPAINAYSNADRFKVN